MRSSGSHRNLRAVLWGIGILLVVGVLPVYAQSGNLLVNPGFEGAYLGRSGISGGVPEGWQVWGNFQDSDHEGLSVMRRSGQYAWRLRSASARPTGGGYQTVTVQRGMTYRFSIYALIWTCDDEDNQCRTATDTFSDTTSNGRVRIGIDPTGGTSPTDSGVRWSAFASPFLSIHNDIGSGFQQLTIEATAISTQITVFTYYTADVSMRFHDAFWDDAALIALDSGTGAGTSDTPAPTAQPTAARVVANPQPRPDGSMVHIVEQGHTLSAIAVAYGLTLDQLYAMNNLAGSLIRPGDEIVVQLPAPTVAPPTAVPTPTPRVQNTPTPSPTGLPLQTGTASTVVPPAPAAVSTAPSGEPDSDPDDEENDTTRSVVLVVAVVVLAGAGALIIGMIAFALYFATRRG